MDPVDRLKEARKQVEIVQGELAEEGHGSRANSLDETLGLIEDKIERIEGREDDDEPDVVAAVEIATDRLAKEFRPRTESETSDMAVLTDHTNSIKAALENGEEPSPGDIRVAIQWLEVVKRDLRDIARLYGRNPWEYGFLWGDLTAEQQAEIQEREDDA